MIPRIAIYGGAFDPPQLAHDTIAREAVKKLRLEKLYIVPSGPRPDKDYKAGKYREELCKLFVDSIGLPQVELCTDFLDGKIENTTLNTDKLFREKLGFSPFQIFGSDVLDLFWGRDPSGEIAMRLPKIIIRRPGNEIEYNKIGNYEILDIEMEDSVAYLSSTIVREDIKKGSFGGLSPSIAEFIMKNKIYL